MPNVDFEGSTHVMKLVTFEKDGRSTVGLLNADGTETALEYALEGDSAVFTLTFAQPLLAVRLVPAM